MFRYVFDNSSIIFSAYECLYAPPVITLDLEIQIEPVNEFAPTFSPAITFKDVTENTSPGMFELCFCPLSIVTTT